MIGFEPTPEVPSLVLDTNAVLDWVVFDDIHMRPLVAAIKTGAVRWLACPRMRDELARTLDYPALARWSPDADQALATFDQWAQMLPTPITLPALRCTDPDDQVFIDLAVATGARWLVTHDRALLRLARRAQAQGVRIVKPTVWQLP